MSVPQPSIALEGHCSAIDNDTLYVLSPAGLQSLPLKDNATWSEEPNGQSVTGPACVTAESQGALYVVGGSSDNDNYGGLQRYFFGNKTWETLSPLANVMQSRTEHSAAYLADSQSILVYAGSQPDAPSDLSSQTFVISTQPPYNIRSFTSTAPPTKQPILEPWNSSTAVMVGGSEYNTGVYTFDATNGWQAFGTNLTDAIAPAARATIVDGSDGSKVLEVYNVNESPNTISQIVLMDADGQPAALGQTLGNGAPSRKRKRDLTLNDWPSYNSSNAPTATRTDCAVAQGPSGMSVISGGSSDAPIALFNQNDNSWIDASKFFDSKDEQQPLKPTSTSSASSSTSATSSATSTTAAAGSKSSGDPTAHQRMLRTLGITLGVLCGIAALFILVLLFLRWRKTRQKKHPDYLDEKSPNRLSFQDRGASFMKEAGVSSNELAPPGKDRYNSGSPSGGGSHSSLAIIAGRMGGNDRNTPSYKQSAPVIAPAPPAKDRYASGVPKGGSHSSLAIIAGKLGGGNRNTSHSQKASFDSVAHLVKDKDGSVVMSEPVEMVNIGDNYTSIARKPVPGSTLAPPGVMDYDTEKELAPMDDRSRSSGWSKYFATSGPTGPNGISHLPAAYLKSQSQSYLTDDGSVYSSQHLSRLPSSVLVPPLDIDFSKTLDGQRLSHVASGSPSFFDSREDLAKRGSMGAEGQAGLIITPRPSSSRSHISGMSLSTNNRMTLSSNITSDYYNESGHTLWSPTANATFKDLSLIHI